MPKIMIDTDILIDVARSVNTAIERLNLETQTASPTISIITQMELMVGCRNKTELQHLKRFIQRYEVIPVDETISNKARKLLEEYYLSHGLLIPDGFIAATALVREIPLLSKNQRDYRFISQLNLLPYP